MEENINNETALYIKQVSEILGLPVHTVRYWGDALGLNNRDSLGKRIYTRNDINILNLIKPMIEKGVSLKAAREYLKEKDMLSDEGNKSSYEGGLIPYDEALAVVVQDAVKTSMEHFYEYVNEKNTELLTELNKKFAADLNIALNEQQERIMGILNGVDESLAKKVSELLTDPIAKRDEELLNQVKEVVSKFEKKPWWKIW